MPRPAVHLSGGRLRAIILIVAAGTVLFGWLLAAPPGASPDDGYHLGSIWCAEGFKDGICVEDPARPDRSQVLLPKPVLEITCFTYDGARSAACQLEALEGSFLQLIPAVTNINGERPTLYYRTMHLLIGDGMDVGAAAGRIRLANMGLTLLLVMATAMLANGRLRTAFLLSWSIAVVPLGLFLVTSVNTSAWGIAGITTFWANLVTAREHPNRRRRIAASTVAAIGIWMALGSRTEAVAHIGIIIVALLAMWGTERLDPSMASLRSLSRRAMLRTVGALASVALMIISLIAIAPQSAGLDGIVGDLREGHARIAARNIGDPILAIAFEVPTLWAGALGHIWGLGALDTPIPSLASLPLMGVFIGLIAVGLHAGARARPRVAGVVVLLVAIFVLPTFSLLRAGLLVYESLQPRQFMVLLFPLLGIALHRLVREAPFTIGLAGRITIMVSLGLAHSVALLVTIQRHTSGLLPGFLGEPRHVDFGRDIEWWWTTAPHPDVVWAIASLAYVLVLALVVRSIPPDSAAQQAS